MLLRSSSPGSVPITDVEQLKFDIMQLLQEIKRGDRIAQLVFQKFESAKFFEVAQLPQSQRAGGGFGSTGQ